MSKFQNLAVLSSVCLLPLPAFASINSADTAWMLTASVLLLLMTPGLAFFYAGMVRKKNVISTLFQNIIASGLIGLLWVSIGYSLAFSGGNEFIGDFGSLQLNGIGQMPNGTSKIPALLFMTFHMMFAIVAPIIMTGAVVERIRFGAWLIMMVLWSLCVYVPVAHWVWSSSGWLFLAGTLDFAGGFVVHMTSGFSALVLAIVIGKRADFGKVHKPHDVSMVLLGTAMLWFSWFGFNAGSALAADGVAVQAFINTFVSAAAAMLMWILIDVIRTKKPSLVGGCFGIICGLVAITPASGFVTVNAAIIIGLLAGLTCNLMARLMKSHFRIDDSLDVFACHGIAGLLGAIMTGVFATTRVNPVGLDGWLNGNPPLLHANIIGALAVAIYSMVVTYFISKLVNLVIPLRVSARDEDRGLDASQHGEAI